MTHSIILDMCFDEPTLEEALDRVGKEFNLETIVINENGPAGGWPEIRFVGERENIIRLLDEGYGMNDDLSVADRDEMLASIVDDDEE